MIVSATSNRFYRMTGRAAEAFRGVRSRTAVDAQTGTVDGRRRQGPR